MVGGFGNTAIGAVNEYYLEIQMISVACFPQSLVISEYKAPGHQSILSPGVRLRVTKGVIRR